jgi:hypothetical protein
MSNTIRTLPYCDLNIAIAQPRQPIKKRNKVDGSGRRCSEGSNNEPSLTWLARKEFSTGSGRFTEKPVDEILQKPDPGTVIRESPTKAKESAHFMYN